MEPQGFSCFGFPSSGIMRAATKLTLNVVSKFQTQVPQLVQKTHHQLSHFPALLLDYYWFV